MNKPISSHLPVMRVRGPSLEQALPRLQMVEESRVFSNFGPQEIELRERYSEFLKVNVAHIATAANATIGLFGAAAITKTQRWLSPSYTFPATPASILAAGKDLLFGDINTNWWLAPTGENYEAIMPTAPFGAAIDFMKWQTHEYVVFDAAASLGANPPNWEIMRENWAVVYSLHATKILGSGEGSILVFGSAQRAAEFRAWTNFGFSGTRNSIMAGLNGKMSEIQAAFAHAALDEWEKEQKDWLRARGLATAIEKQIPIKGLPWSAEGVNPYWIVSFNSTEETTMVENALKEAGIESRRWWGLGCHTMAAYSEIPRTNLAHTDYIASLNLGLPMFRGIKETEITQIAEVIQKTLTL